MTDEQQAIVLRYLEQIDSKLDLLMRELLDARRRAVEDLPPDLRDGPDDTLGPLLDKLAALSPEAFRRNLERAETVLRERMAEQPGASFMDLDLSDRTKH